MENSYVYWGFAIFAFGILLWRSDNERFNGRGLIYG